LVATVLLNTQYKNVTIKMEQEKGYGSVKAMVKNRASV
jgi:hypothetical protein